MGQLVMTAAMLVLSFTAAAQEEQTMIVRLAEIEVYPQHLQEYLEYANEVNRLIAEREPGIPSVFSFNRSRQGLICRPFYLNLY